MHILVAEDNETNQDVVKAMLTRIGCKATVVDNGFKAVEAYQTGDFDLILMDCQMPDMDGFQATSNIRKLELKKASKRVPIIAMTANAMRCDYERCLSEGMDDYMTKPVRFALFESVIQKWSVEKIEDPLMDKSQKNSGERFDDDAISLLFDLAESNSDPALVDNTIGRFLESAQNELEDIELSLKEKNFNEASKKAHKFKTSCGVVGAKKCAELCQRMEDLSASQEDLPIEQTLVVLVAEVVCAIDYLSNCLAQKAGHKE